MNWKEIKKSWQESENEMWTQHPKGHKKAKKQARINRKQGRA